MSAGNLPEPQGRGKGPPPLARAFTSRRRRTGPPSRALLGSILLHGFLVITVLGSTQLQPSEDPSLKFKTYRVELYSPPPQVEGPPEPAPEVPKPAIIKKPTPPEPKKPEVKAQPVVKKTPTPPKADESSKRTAENKKRPVRGRNAQPGPVGGEGLNVLQEGEDFPYPEYLENVVLQLHRYFRWDGAADLEVEVGFYIKRNGSISGLRVSRRSGQYQFDIAAADAVNNASRDRVFGALPKGFERDSLGVLFSFRPPGR